MLNALIHHALQLDTVEAGIIVRVSAVSVYGHDLRGGAFEHSAAVGNAFVNTRLKEGACMYDECCSR
jgi:hypothetical protein